MKKSFFVFIILISISSMMMTGCARKMPEIVLDEEDFSALSPLIKWALVKEPYVTIRSSPSEESDSSGYSRKGDVLKIEGVGIENGERWYLVKDGYIPATSVQVFSNKYRAVNESHIITQ